MLILPRPAHIYRKIKLNLSANFTLPLVFKKVLDAYDLDLIDYHLKPRGGNRATNIILQTSKGKKLIKKYKESLSRSTIVQEHSILHFLKTVSFPAPRLFTAKTEDTLIECDNHFFAVFDFIESGFQYHHYFLNEKKQNNYIQIAGETLGQLHKELENFIPQGHNPDGFRSKTESRKRDLIWYLEKLERCVNQSPVSKNKNKTNFLLDKSEYLKEEICRCEELLNQAELPRMIIHGDYGPYNLLFQKSGLVYVLDFEMARIEWRLAEIVRAWYRFCFDRNGFNLPKMKLFLESYQAYMSLTAGEFRLIPEVWKFVNLRGSIRSWHTYNETLKDKMITDSNRCIEHIDWINNNQKKLLEILRN